MSTLWMLGAVSMLYAASSSDDSLLLVREYYIRKEYFKADHLLQAILEKNPNSEEASALMKRVQLQIAGLIQYAKSQDRKGNACLPEELFNQLRIAFPTSPKPLLLLGEHYLLLKEHVKAEAYFLQAIALNPTDPALQGALATFYYHAGMPELAHREARRMLKKDPDEEEALTLVEEMEDRSEDILAPAKHLIKDKRYPEAISLYERAVTLDPDKKEYLDQLGTLYLLNRQPEESAECFAYLKELEPEDNYVRMSLIRAYLASDEYQAAREEIKELQNRSMNREIEELLQKAVVDADVVEAKVLDKQECYCQAILIYERLLEEDHKDLLVLNQLGSLYMKIEDLCTAKKYLLRSLDLNPKDLEAKTLLATLYFRQKSYQEAQELVVKILCEDPYNTDANFLQARLLQLCRRDKESKEYLEKAVLTDGNRADLRRALGSHLAKYNRYSAAYRQFEVAWEKEGECEDLDRLIGLRPFIKPTLETEFIYSREKEQDLVTKKYVALLRNREYAEKLTLPVVAYLQPYLFFRYAPSIQLNLLQNRNNYNVDIFRYGVGIKSHWRDLWTFNLETQTRDGKGRPGVIYPFENEKIREPSASIRYHPKKQRLSLYGGHDALIGRNVPKTTSIFVKMREVSGLYEFLFSPPYSALGVEGKKVWYEALRANQKREFAGWARYALLKKPLYLIAEYRAKRGHFDHVVQTYTSYKRRDEQHFKVTFLKNWGLRQSMELYYMYSKETWRDFVQQATIFASPVNTILKVNRFEAHTVEAIYKKVFLDSYHLEVAGKWYKNTNNYRAISARVGFKWVF